MLTRKCMGWPLSTGGGAAGLDGNHPPLLSLAAWPVGVGECGNRTISPRTLQCKQQKLNSHWPRQRRNLPALMKGEDTRAALGSEGKSLGTRASRRATVRWVPPGLSPVLPIFHQHFTVSFHLLASISDGRSPRGIEVAAPAKRELLAPRVYASVAGKDSDRTHRCCQVGGVLWVASLDHVTTLLARTWAVIGGRDTGKLPGKIQTSSPLYKRWTE